LAEHVDAAADPLSLELRCLAEAGHPLALEVDDPERRPKRDDRDRRRGAGRPLRLEQPAEVDVDELVAVQGEDLTRLTARRCREADASAAAEGLRLAYGDDLGPDPAERGLEQPL